MMLLNRTSLALVAGMLVSTNCKGQIPAVPEPILPERQHVVDGRHDVIIRVEGRTGRPQASVEVSLSDSSEPKGRWYGWTDLHGQVVFPNRQPGPYRLGFGCIGDLLHSHVELPPEGSIVAAFELSSVCKKKLPPECVPAGQPCRWPRTTDEPGR